METELQLEPQPESKSDILNPWARALTFDIWAEAEAEAAEEADNGRAVKPSNIFYVLRICRRQRQTLPERESKGSPRRQGAHIKKEGTNRREKGREAKCFFEVEKITLQQLRHPRIGHTYQTCTQCCQTRLSLCPSPTNTLWGNQNRPKCHL